MTVSERHCEPTRFVFVTRTLRTQWEQNTYQHQIAAATLVVRQFFQHGCYGGSYDRRRAKGFSLNSETATGSIVKGGYLQNLNRCR